MIQIMQLDRLIVHRASAAQCKKSQNVATCHHIFSNYLYILPPSLKCSSSKINPSPQSKCKKTLTPLRYKVIIWQLTHAHVARTPSACQRVVVGGRPAGERKIGRRRLSSFVRRLWLYERQTIRDLTL
jgi:hypothetical protein